MGAGLYLPGSTGRRRAAEPTVPVELADAVEEWARRWGRHARITHLMQTDPPTPQVRLTPRHGDPRLKPVMEGRWAPEEAEEVVHLWEWSADKKCYVGVPLTDLGVGGVMEWLQRGNTLSGSGEFDSLQEALDHVREERKRKSEQFHDEVMDDVRQIAKAVGPHLLGEAQGRGAEFSERSSHEEPTIITPEDEP